MKKCKRCGKEYRVGLVFESTQPGIHDRLYQET